MVSGLAVYSPGMDEKKSFTRNWHPIVTASVCATLAALLYTILEGQFYTPHGEWFQELRWIGYLICSIWIFLVTFGLCGLIAIGLKSLNADMSLDDAQPRSRQFWVVLFSLILLFGMLVPVFARAMAGKPVEFAYRLLQLEWYLDSNSNSPDSQLHPSVDRDSQIKDDRYKDYYEVMVYWLNAHPEADESKVSKIAQLSGPSQLVDEAVLKHPHLSPAALMAILYDSRGRYKLSSAFNEMIKDRLNDPQQPTEMIIIYRSIDPLRLRTMSPVRVLLPSEEIRNEKAGVQPSSQTDPSLLARMINSSDPVERKSAATNPDTTTDALRILAKDQDSEVRASVLYNKKTPPDVVAELCQDPVERVRYWAVRFCHDPEILRKAILEDPSEGVRSSAMRNDDALPIELLSQLAADPGSLIRAAVAKSFRATPEMLTKLAGDSEPIVLNEVRKNPLTPRDVRERVEQNPALQSWLQSYRDPATHFDREKEYEAWKIKNGVK
jgi:hypothetical protein